MNDIQNTYLKLLRAALWGAEVTNERMKELTSERVNEIIRLAAFQGTGPLVYDQLLKLKDVDIPAGLRMQMMQQCLHSMMLQQSMASLLSKAWRALEQADIHPVLLKGFGLAQYYPQPHLRQWGDIDLYVGQANYHKACDVLREEFPEALHPSEEDEEYKHYNLDFENTVIETHRVSMTFAHPRDRQYYEGLETKYLTKDGPTFDCEGLAVTTPEETYNIFFVFLHAWHHFFETGMNMKQLCDIAILLHTKRDVINKEQLHEMLTKLHLMEVWQLIMYIMVHYLGVPIEECPFYSERSKDRAELLLTQVIKEGSSYRKEEVNAESVRCRVYGVSYLKRKWLTFQSRLDDSKRVKVYAPKYARHMVVSDILHGVERMLKMK